MQFARDPGQPIYIVTVASYCMESKNCSKTGVTASNLSLNIFDIPPIHNGESY